MKGGYCRGVKGGYCRGGRVQDRKVMAYYGLLEEGREYRGERVIKVGYGGFHTPRAIYKVFDLVGCCIFVIEIMS